MDYAKATKYADISVNLVDSLIAYSKDLKSDFENNYSELTVISVSYTHLTLPTILRSCRSRWSPYH